MMAAPLEFVYRFDAGPEVGAGHFMRQLALAQRTQDLGPTTMLVPPQAAALAAECDDRIALEPLPSLDTDAEVRWLTERFSRGIFFVDSYTLPPAFYRRLAGLAPLVAFEDGERDLEGDLVVKPRPRKREGARASHRVLEGCEYVPVRQAFTDHAQARKRRPTSEKRRLLVSFGAADAGRATAAMLERLPAQAASEWHVTVVAGPLANARGLDPFGAEALTARGWDVEVTTAPEMAALMASVDAAITSAGSIVWELATLSVPTLVLPIADNQQRNAELLGDLGCVASVDQLDAFLRSGELRVDLAARLHALVDGRGAERIVDAVVEKLR